MNQSKSVFEIYVFVPNGTGVSKPDYVTEDPVHAAALTVLLKQLFENGIVDCIYIYFKKRLIEYYER